MMHLGRALNRKIKHLGGFFFHEHIKANIPHRIRQSYTYSTDKLKVSIQIKGLLKELIGTN